MRCVSVFIVLICVSNSVCANGLKLDTLLERIKKLEIRLTEETFLLRKEMYAELEEIQQLSSIAETMDFFEHLDQFNSTLSNFLIGRFKSFKSEMDFKFQYLQKGFNQEKRTVRSLRDNITTSVESATARSDMVESLLLNVSKEVSRSFQDSMKTLSEKLTTIQDLLKTVTTSTSESNIKQDRFKDCSDLLRHGHLSSGIYTIHPDTIWRPLQVYCDMTTAGGGWTVFQRRKDGTENFQRLWLDYAFGFGSLDGEFWLGNEFIHRLTSSAPHEMRIELEDFENDRRVAEYGLFSVAAPSDLYKLSVQYFTGNVSDSLIQVHNGRHFSTTDNGPSTNCANSYKGGFWYNSCHAVNINGLYLKGHHESYADGVNWHGWKGYNYSLKMTEMKFRPK